MLRQVLSNLHTTEKQWNMGRQHNTLNIPEKYEFLLHEEGSLQKPKDYNTVP